MNRALAAGLVRQSVVLAMATSMGAGEVVERILAVVEGQPVVLSEVRLMERVSGLDRSRALEALIDERLMFREASRLPQATVSAQEEERARQSLRERLGSALEGLPEAALRQLARRQAAIVKYVEFRFRPQVRVPPEAVRRAYEEAYAGQTSLPSFEEASAALQASLAQQDLDQRIEAWVKELRASADIRYNPPEPASGVSPPAEAARAAEGS